MSEIHGHMHIADVSERPTEIRTAIATGKVILNEEIFRLIREHRMPKGDVLTIAEIAGIMGAKKTGELIPLTRTVILDGMNLDLDLDEEEYAINIRASMKSKGPVGVEMEALTAVSVAALTIYDMCKSISKDIRIADIHLVAKTGGQSGAYLKAD